MIFIAFVSIFLTIKSGGFQIKKFGFILRNTISRILERPESNVKGITPFQATSTALASTIGMGSIAGVATAMSIGGPGSIFWMWLSALFGMMSKTAEVTLAVHYREVSEDGHIHGGPMYYITKGLGWKGLAKLFSVGILVNGMLAASLLQPHTVGRALLASYHISPYFTAGAMAIITGLVVIGGVKRIGQFSEKVVPFMSIIYILAGLIIFVVNYEKIPEIFYLIVRCAFEPMPAVGGFVGTTVFLTIQKGMSRGMLSTEAGMGTAPMAHANAKTKHPFAQGLWGSFEVFLVTVICTITAFSILSTGVLGNGKSGIELAMDAFLGVYPKFLVDLIISFSILAFCLTSQIGFFIYFENAVINIFGKSAMNTLKWVYLMPGVIFAGIANVDGLWIFADIAVGVCAVPNLIAVLALNGVFFKLMKDYTAGIHKFRTDIVDQNRNYVRMAKKN